MTIILDSFDPDEGPREVDLREASDALLRQLVISGSREAMQELERRRQDG